MGTAQTPAHSAAAALLRATLPLMKKVPPVDLGVVCDHLGIEVYSHPCGAFGAVCVWKGQRRILMVNASMNLGRARFSIAHELGHVLLGHRFEHGRNAGPGLPVPRIAWQERQADRFAVELLMPASLLAGEPRAQGGDCGVAELSRRYKVSAQAMRIRLEALGLLRAPAAGGGASAGMRIFGP